MLVPSYSSGKTRSVRIPYGIFYFIIIAAIVIGAVTTTFYMQSRFFRGVAQDFSISLEQAHDAYIELQHLSEYEQNRLAYDRDTLHQILNQERIRSHEERLNQQRSYQESLDTIQQQVEEMERLIEGFEQHRQEILDRLGARAYIPPVRNLLNDLVSTQNVMLSSINTLPIHTDERSSARFTTADDLASNFLVLTSRLETQMDLHSYLAASVDRMVPYLNNYPTRQPVPGRIGSGFGLRRNPMGGGGTEFHHGVDIGGRTGDPVRATGGGTVSFAGWRGGFGYLVIIDHGFGIQTYYAHNSANIVRVGQRVERGEQIARLGSTGRSTAPHVHYEVRVNGTPVNPVNFFLER